MVETITLGLVGVEIVKGGIKFLYDQAGEVLKRWREHKKDPDKATAPVTVADPNFEQLTAPVKIDLDVVETLNEELSAARKELTEYADGILDYDPNDQSLLKNVNVLRTLMESVYGSPLTFKGEQRAANEVLINSIADIQSVKGYAAAVRIENIEKGTINANSKVGEVSEKGTFVGVDIKAIKS